MLDPNKAVEQMQSEFAAGFQAGAASRDAEVVSLTNQRDYEYVRAENAEQERDQLREQLAEREKQVVLLWDALAMWNVASENSEESELDDMACYCVPMPLFCDADEAMGDALAKVRKP